MKRFILTFLFLFIALNSNAQQDPFVQGINLDILNEVERRLLREEIEIVDLTTDVSGILPVANGGTGSTLILPVANGGTGQDFSAAVEGEIFYVSATGVISALGTGTSGQRLESQGASNPPFWATVISPGWEFIAFQSFETVTTDIITYSFTDGDTYRIIGNWRNSNVQSTMEIRFDGDTGNNYTAANLTSLDGFDLTDIGSNMGLNATEIIIELLFRVVGNNILIKGNTSAWDGTNDGTAIIHGQYTGSSSIGSVSVTTTGSSQTITGQWYLFKASTS